MCGGGESTWKCVWVDERNRKSEGVLVPTYIYHSICTWTPTVRVCHGVHQATRHPSFPSFSQNHPHSIPSVHVTVLCLTFHSHGVVCAQIVSQCLLHLQLVLVYSFSTAVGLVIGLY